MNITTHNHTPASIGKPSEEESGAHYNEKGTKVVMTFDLMGCSKCTWGIMVRCPQALEHIVYAFSFNTLYSGDGV